MKRPPTASCPAVAAKQLAADGAAAASLLHTQSSPSSLFSRDYYTPRHPFFASAAPLCSTLYDGVPAPQPWALWRRQLFSAFLLFVIVLSGLQVILGIGFSGVSIAYNKLLSNLSAMALALGPIPLLVEVCKKYHWIVPAVGSGLLSSYGFISQWLDADSLGFLGDTCLGLLLGLGNCALFVPVVGMWLAYPPENQRGRSFVLFWISYQLPMVASAVLLLLIDPNSGTVAVQDEQRFQSLLFLVAGVMLSGGLLCCLFLAPPRKVLKNRENSASLHSVPGVTKVSLNEDYTTCPDGYEAVEEDRSADGQAGAHRLLTILRRWKTLYCLAPFMTYNSFSSYHSRVSYARHALSSRLRCLTLTLCVAGHLLGATTSGLIAESSSIEGWEEWLPWTRRRATGPGSAATAAVPEMPPTAVLVAHPKEAEGVELPGGTLMKPLTYNVVVENGKVITRRRVCFETEEDHQSQAQHTWAEFQLPSTSDVAAKFTSMASDLTAKFTPAAMTSLAPTTVSSSSGCRTAMTQRAPTPAPVILRSALKSSDRNNNNAASSVEENATRHVEFALTIQEQQPQLPPLVTYTDEPKAALRAIARSRSGLLLGTALVLKFAWVALFMVLFYLERYSLSNNTTNRADQTIVGRRLSVMEVNQRSPTSAAFERWVGGVQCLQKYSRFSAGKSPTVAIAKCRAISVGRWNSVREQWIGREQGATAITHRGQTKHFVQSSDKRSQSPRSTEQRSQPLLSGTKDQSHDSTSSITEETQVPEQRTEKPQGDSASVAIHDRPLSGNEWIHKTGGGVQERPSLLLLSACLDGTSAAVCSALTMYILGTLGRHRYVTAAYLAGIFYGTETLGRAFAWLMGLWVGRAGSDAWAAVTLLAGAALSAPFAWHATVTLFPIDLDGELPSGDFRSPSTTVTATTTTATTMAAATTTTITKTPSSKATSISTVSSSKSSSESKRSRYASRFSNLPTPHQKSVVMFAPPPELLRQQQNMAPPLKRSRSAASPDTTARSSLWDDQTPQVSECPPSVKNRNELLDRRFATPALPRTGPVPSDQVPDLPMISEEEKSHSRSGRRPSLLQKSVLHFLRLN